MLHISRFRPSPAMVVAVIALVVAGTGGAVAAVVSHSHGDSKSDTKLVKGYLAKHKVPSAKQADTAGTASSATNASHATNADHATTADTATNATSLGGKAASAYASATPEAVHKVGATGEPAFENGTSNFNSITTPVEFYIDSMGIVHIQGYFSNPAAETAVFILPAAYRPTTAHYFPIEMNSGYGSAFVNPDGTVYVRDVASGASSASLDGITFRAGT